MKQIRFFFILLLLTFNFSSSLNAENFEDWVIKFKKKAIKNNISSATVNAIMDKAIFLPKVIEYDRYQPEFYEDTFTYVKKRSSRKKIKDDTDKAAASGALFAFENCT